MTARPSTRSHSRLGLTREAVVAAANGLLRDGGLEAVTMRAVAQRVGVGTMTLYGYFADKDELLDAVIDANAAELTIPDAPGPWKERLRALMLALHDQLVAHPFLVELRLRRPLASPGAFRWTEVGLRILQDAGLSPPKAAEAFRPLFIYTFGHASFEPRGNSEDVIRQALVALAALPREQYPVTTAAAPQLARSLVGPQPYELGLDLILDGIEGHYIAAKSPPSASRARGPARAS